MRRLLSVFMLSALAGLLVVGPASAQWDSITTNTINPATTTKAIKIGPAGSEVTISTTGEMSVASGGAHTDAFVFIPAWGNCVGDTTNLTPVRVAASDWALARTATASETIQITCSLNSWLQRVGTTKGVKITGVRIHHQITVVALGAATWGKIATRGFANNTANALTGNDLATAPTLPIAVQTNPYLTSVAMASAAYLPANANQSIELEYAVLLQNTTVYRLYGLTVVFTRQDH